MRHLIRFFLAMLLLVMPGCGSSKPSVPFGNVRGRVTFDGQPLANAAVMFEPDTGRPSYGMTSDTGEYTLRYRGQPWGAIAGRHRVRITTEGLVKDSPDDPTPTVVKEKLPPKYHSATALTAEVKPGDNVIDFDLTAD
jgi:hypothetical protein